MSKKSKKAATEYLGFARLFGEGKDQILVTCETDDDTDAPMIAFSVSPVMFGVGSQDARTSIRCHYATDEKRDEVFKTIDEQFARRIAAKLKQSCLDIFGD